MINLKHLISYRILRVYVSYKQDTSTIICRTMISCPRNISNADVVDYISDNMLQTLSPSKSIHMLEDKDIHTLKDNDKDYRHYDIIASFDRIGIIDIQRYCKYKTGKYYSFKNDILLKMKI